MSDLADGEQESRLRRELEAAEERLRTAPPDQKTTARDQYRQVLQSFAKLVLGAK